ncbi:retrovirus-related pol polyprotein from transposon TNT 1-94 [Tanacetum coccineum]
MEKRKKHFAKLKAKEIRRKPPTKAQKRNQMCTYLKNMANYKHSQLKNKSFEENQMLFDNTMKWVDSFVPMDTEKQKIDENVEAELDDEAEMNKLIEIVPGDEVAIDAIPLATKSSIIVDWKIIKEGKMGYFQIIRVDGSSRRITTARRVSTVKRIKTREMIKMKIVYQDYLWDKRNRTLVEAARTMLSASKLPLFFWAEAIATAYGENLDKMKEKGDPCILVGYSTQSKGYRVYSKRTRLIIESIHINFDEINELLKASDYDNSGPVPQLKKTSNHNRSKIETHDHNNEPSSLTLVLNVSPSADADTPSLQELDFLYSPLFGEYFFVGNQSVSKSSTLTDNSPPQDTPPTTNIQTTIEQITTTATVTAKENNTDVQAEDAQIDDNEFYNIFSTPVHEEAELSTRYAKYALEILKKNGMERCESLGTPLATKPKLDADLSGTPIDQTKYHSMIRSLMYLTSSRPDLVQAVCYCARYQAKPTIKHLKEVKIIFRYLKGTINMELWYPKDSGFELTAFSNADHARCLDTRKITSRGIQFLGDKLVRWMSKKQDCTAMYSAEAEYVALFASCAQVIRMRTQLKDYGFDYNNIPLYCDSQSAIATPCNTPVPRTFILDTTLSRNSPSRRKVLVSRQTNWYEMFDSSRTGASYGTVLASCQHSTLCVRKYSVSELSSWAGSELGSDLTLLAGCELKTSELDTSELKTSEYRNSVHLISDQRVVKSLPTSYFQRVTGQRMANLSEDIQCAGSDTRPPMLDRTDFASWQQRIRLYCRGKENGVNILKLIDEGPFQMGIFWETLAEGNEGALHLGPERPRVYSDLSPEDKERYNADIQATNILLQGLPKDIYSLINHYTDAKDMG